MIKKQVINDIEKKLEELGWEKFEDFHFNQVKKYITDEKVRTGYMYYSDEMREKLIEDEQQSGVLFGGELYKRIMLIYVIFLENGQMIVSDNIEYFIFHYLKTNKDIGKQWELNKDDIDHWTTRNKIIDLKEVIYYINHLSDVDNAWDKENELMNKFNNLSQEEFFKMFHEKRKCEEKNIPYKDEFSHMHFRAIDWEEDVEYYSDAWGETEQEKEDYYKILKFQRDSIPEFM